MIYTIPGSKRPRWALVPLDDDVRRKEMELLETMAQKFAGLRAAPVRVCRNWPEQDGSAGGDVRPRAGATGSSGSMS